MDKKKVLNILKYTILILLIIIFSLICDAFIVFIGLAAKVNLILVTSMCLIIPFILFPLLFKKEIRQKLYIFVVIYTILIIIGIVASVIFAIYDESLVINTDVNINVKEYLPFVENTKIYKLQNESNLTFANNEYLPILDGSNKLFPIYSAFVNAVYPNTVKLYNYPFLNTNEINGYTSLAYQNIDIFFGKYPSFAQIEEAKKVGTEFEYTNIGLDAFVFFVNKDNPVNSLTTREIKDIYSGKITNWKEVGGKNEKILAFQREENSESQKMFKNFMGNRSIIEPIKNDVEDISKGIVDEVADYKNYSNSIGFSFKYDLKDAIENKNIKVIKIDSITPSSENMLNGKYVLFSPIYAVTYKRNKNENVYKFINWMLSDEGQNIVKNSGYDGI